MSFLVFCNLCKAIWAYGDICVHNTLTIVDTDDNGDDFILPTNSKKSAKGIICATKEEHVAIAKTDIRQHLNILQGTVTSEDTKVRPSLAERIMISNMTKVGMCMFYFLLLYHMVFTT